MVKSEDANRGIASNPVPRFHYVASSKSSSPLRKVKLLSAGSEAPSVMSSSPIIQSPVPLRRIKPPPTIFADFWNEVPEQTVTTEISSTLTEIIEEQASDCESIEHVEVEEAYTYEHTLDIVEKNDPVPDKDGKKPQLLITENLRVTSLHEHEEKYTANALFEFEYTPILEDFENEFDQSAYLLDDLELLDIDAALAEQEEALLRLQPKKSNVALHPGRGQVPGWQGAVSLSYVNWEHEEEAIQEALNRLGYAEIAISEATRAFILQAARVAGLPYQQELQLTTRLATARTQLSQIPPYDDPENDPYITKRNRLKADIAELERTLVYKMQWVAIKKAPQFLGNNIEIDDLIQYGMLGIIAGVKHFDSSRQSKLLSVVTMWVFQSLRRAINDYGRLIRMPSYISEKLDTIKKKHLHLQMTLGRLPSRPELANAMQISIDYLEFLLDNHKEHLSLEKCCYTEYTNDGYSFQTINDNIVINRGTLPDQEDQVGMKQLVVDLLSCLSARERYVIYLRFGLGENVDAHTLEEIGKVLDVTRERIRQIESRALKKMKESLLALKMINLRTGEDNLNESKMNAQQAEERSKKTPKIAHPIARSTK
jgi:RNA polymerase primary sigma factor